MYNQYPPYPSQNPQYLPQKKNYFVMRFWIIFVLFLISGFFKLASSAYFIISCYNTYQVFVKVGKISHQTYQKNPKTFVNKWLLAIFLSVVGVILVIFNVFNAIIANFKSGSIKENLSNYNEFGLLMILIILTTFIVSFLLFIINEGKMYKFLDKFENQQQITPNNFFSRFAFTLVFKFTGCFLILFSWKNFDITNVYQSLFHTGLIIFLGLVCYLIGCIAKLINWYKVCYKMDVLQI